MVDEPIDLPHLRGFLLAFAIMIIVWCIHAILSGLRHVTEELRQLHAVPPTPVHGHLPIIPAYTTPVRSVRTPMLRFPAPPVYHIGPVPLHPDFQPITMPVTTPRDHGLARYPFTIDQLRNFARESLKLAHGDTATAPNAWPMPAIWANPITGVPNTPSRFEVLCAAIASLLLIVDPHPNAYNLGRLTGGTFGARTEDRGRIFRREKTFYRYAIAQMTLVVMVGRFGASCPEGTLAQFRLTHHNLYRDVGRQAMAIFLFYFNRRSVITAALVDDFRFADNPFLNIQGCKIWSFDRLNAIIAAGPLHGTLTTNMCFIGWIPFLLVTTVGSFGGVTFNYNLHRQTVLNNELSLASITYYHSLRNYEGTFPLNAHHGQGVPVVNFQTLSIYIPLAGNDLNTYRATEVHNQIMPVLMIPNYAV